jgi:hypothetical protein
MTDLKSDSEAKEIIHLHDPRLHDAYNSFSTRNFERQAGTLENKRVYLAPSQFQLLIDKKKATKFSLERKKKQASSNKNLGLFAGEDIKANACITYYGGDYLTREVCNTNLVILNQLNRSTHLALINKQKIVVGDVSAEFIDRNTVVSLKKEDKKQSCRETREYYSFDALPAALKHRFTSQKQYEDYRDQLMNCGVGYCINQPKQFIPQFRNWMSTLNRKGVTKKQKTDIILQLTKTGMNCLMDKHIQQDLMDINDGRSAVFVVFTALRDIKEHEEIICYYNADNQTVHDAFFQVNTTMSTEPELFPS